MPRTAHILDKKWRSEDIRLEENVDFSALLLSERVLNGLKAAGFLRPSPIQLQAIPLGRCGLDLVVQAKSGTGKTCVFTVIALENLIDTPATQVLILAPTREIAAQICDTVASIGSSIPNLTCNMFIGGMPFAVDQENLKNCQIVIGTPGRIKHLIESKALQTSSIRLFVLDEADKLLNSQFQGDINWIFSSLPCNKQVIALSATYPKQLADLATHYMRSPSFVRLNLTDVAPKGLLQFYCITEFHPIAHIAYEFKLEVLWKIINTVTFSQCLVFCGLLTRVKPLCDELNRRGFPTASLSSIEDQETRLDSLHQLRDFQCRVLVTTDLAARGIDAENVDLVINMDVPYDMETYLHRIGRSGRYGSKGVAITLLSQGVEEGKLMSFKKNSDLKIYRIPDPLPSNLLKWTDEMINEYARSFTEKQLNVVDVSASEASKKTEKDNSVSQADLPFGIEECDDENNKFSIDVKSDVSSECVQEAKEISYNNGIPRNITDVNGIKESNDENSKFSSDTKYDVSVESVQEAKEISYNNSISTSITDVNEVKESNDENSKFNSDVKNDISMESVQESKEISYNNGISTSVIHVNERNASGYNICNKTNMPSCLGRSVNTQEDSNFNLLQDESLSKTKDNDYNISNLTNNSSNSEVCKPELSELTNNIQINVLPESYIPNATNSHEKLSSSDISSEKTVKYGNIPLNDMSTEMDLNSKASDQSNNNQQNNIFALESLHLSENGDLSSLVNSDKGNVSEDNDSKPSIMCTNLSLDVSDLKKDVFQTAVFESGVSSNTTNTSEQKSENATTQNCVENKVSSEINHMHKHAEVNELSNHISSSKDSKNELNVFSKYTTAFQPSSASNSLKTESVNNGSQETCYNLNEKVAKTICESQHTEANSSQATSCMKNFLNDLQDMDNFFTSGGEHITSHEISEIISPVFEKQTNDCTNFTYSTILNDFNSFQQNSEYQVISSDKSVSSIPVLTEDNLAKINKYLMETKEAFMFKVHRNLVDHRNEIVTNIDESTDIKNIKMPETSYISNKNSCETENFNEEVVVAVDNLVQKLENSHDDSDNKERDENNDGNNFFELPKLGNVLTELDKHKEKNSALELKNKNYALSGGSHINNIEEISSKEERNASVYKNMQNLTVSSNINTGTVIKNQSLKSNAVGFISVAEKLKPKQATEFNMDKNKINSQHDAANSDVTKTFPVQNTHLTEYIKSTKKPIVITNFRNKYSSSCSSGSSEKSTSVKESENSKSHSSIVPNSCQVLKTQKNNYKKLVPDISTYHSKARNVQYMHWKSNFQNSRISNKNNEFDNMKQKEKYSRKSKVGKELGKADVQKCFNCLKSDERFLKNKSSCYNYSTCPVEIQSAINVIRRKSVHKKSRCAYQGDCKDHFKPCQQCMCITCLYNKSFSIFNNDMHECSCGVKSCQNLKCSSCCLRKSAFCCSSHEYNCSQKKCSSIIQPLYPYLGFVDYKKIYERQQKCIESWKKFPCRY